MLGIPPVVFMGPGHEIFNRLRYVAVVFVSPWSSRRGHQKQMFWGVPLSGPHRNLLALGSCCLYSNCSWECATHYPLKCLGNYSICPLGCNPFSQYFLAGRLTQIAAGPVGGGEGTDVPGFSHTFAFFAHHSRYRDQKLVFRPCFSFRCSE